MVVEGEVEVKNSPPIQDLAKIISCGIKSLESCNPDLQLEVSAKATVKDKENANGKDKMIVLRCVPINLGGSKPRDIKNLIQERLKSLLSQNQFTDYYVVWNGESFNDQPL